MGEESMCGGMEAIMMGIGLIIRSLAGVFTSGLTVESMKENGSIIKCMAGENISGKMEEGMMGSIALIRNMVWVSILGQTAANIMGSGSTASDTEEEK